MTFPFRQYHRVTKTEDQDVETSIENIVTIKHAGHTLLSRFKFLISFILIKWLNKLSIQITSYIDLTAGAITARKIKLPWALYPVHIFFSEYLMLLQLKTEEIKVAFECILASGIEIDYSEQYKIRFSRLMYFVCSF